MEVFHAVTYILCCNGKLCVFFLNIEGKLVRSLWVFDVIRYARLALFYLCASQGFLREEDL